MSTPPVASLAEIQKLLTAVVVETEANRGLLQGILMELANASTRAPAARASRASAAAAAPIEAPQPLDPSAPIPRETISTWTAYFKKFFYVDREKFPHITREAEKRVAIGASPADRLKQLQTAIKGEGQEAVLKTCQALLRLYKDGADTVEACREAATVTRVDPKTRQSTTTRVSLLGLPWDPYEDHRDTVVAVEEKSSAPAPTPVAAPARKRAPAGKKTVAPPPPPPPVSEDESEDDDIEPADDPADYSAEDDDVDDDNDVDD